MASGGVSGNVADVTDDSAIPAFDSLPRLPGNNVQHAWDVWGRDDNLGTLNRLTGPVVAAAAAGVRAGERIGVSLPLGLPTPTFFGRKTYSHHFKPLGPNGWDDWVDGLYLQGSTQWDGLRHVGSPDGWFGGWRGDPADDLDPLGIHHWATGGIVGRGVLVDLAAQAPAGYDPFTRVAFRPADVDAALRAQRVSLRSGDILCVRTGWTDKYLTLTAGERAPLAARHQTISGYESAGLAGSEDMARFLWDSGVAAVAADNPAVEVVAVDPAEGSLHSRLIPGLGMAIGELFSFGDLAAACARAGRYEFLFVSVPLNVTGAVGSPGNAVAVL
jgi:kynurenine formamidase